MLKKAGIVAAVATAGVLALSPLAFAQGNGDNGGHGDRDRDRGSSQTNAFSFEDESVERNQVNLCSFDQDAETYAGLLGPVLPLVSQDQNDNCVNIGDGVYSPAPTTTPVVPPPVITP